MKNVLFTCPSCHNEAMIEEVTVCDGVISPIIAMDEQGNPVIGECVGDGDVDDVYYQCSDCGAKIEDIDSCAGLLADGCITLGDDYIGPDEIRKSLQNLTITMRALVKRINHPEDHRLVVDDDVYRYLAQAERVVQSFL